jgi:F-type H+-transporting ATPase subunit b
VVVTPVLASDAAGLLTVNGTLIAEIIAFILMVLILAKWVYPVIIRVAEAREKTIAAGLKAAEESEKRLAEVKEQVAQLLDEAKAQAREILSQAQREASAEAEEARAKAKADAEAIVERARGEIGVERDRAIQEIRAEMSSLVIAATEQVLGEVIDAKTHQRLIDQALSKVAQTSPSKAQQN